MDARRAYVRLCVYIDATLLLRGRPFNSWGGGGWVILKKISCKRLSEEKNCMQHKCNIESLWGRKGKIYPAHQTARKKKFLVTRNHPPHPPRVKWSAP